MIDPSCYDCQQTTGGCQAHSQIRVTFTPPLYLTEGQQILQELENIRQLLREICVAIGGHPSR